MKLLILFAALAATSGPPPGMVVALEVRGLPNGKDRPAKPEQVTAILTTADGRRWKAHWEEIK